MKTKTLLLATLLAPGLAFAGAGKTMPAEHHHLPHLSGFYLKAEGGISMPTTIKAVITPANTTGQAKTRTSYAVGLGVGYTVNEYFRTDVILGYREWNVKNSSGNNGDDSNIRNTSGTLNGYLEMPNSTMFTPYALVGVGVGKLGLHSKDPEGNNLLGTTTSLNFMWNVGVGARANIYNNFAVDLTYKYVNFGTTTLKEGVGQSTTKLKGLKANELLIGLVYKI